MGNELKPDLHALVRDALDSCIAGGYRDIDGDWCERRWFDEDKVKAAKAALSPSASDPVGEPTDEQIGAKWAELCTGNHSSWIEKMRSMIRHFASPLPQEPREAALTDEEIDAIAMQHCGDLWGGRLCMARDQRIAFARAIERELRGAQEGKAGEWLPQIKTGGFGFQIVEGLGVPADEIHIRNASGQLLGKIVGIPTLNESADSRGEKG